MLEEKVLKIERENVVHLIAGISASVPRISLRTFTLVFGNRKIGCCADSSLFFRRSNDIDVLFATTQETNFVVLTESRFLIAVVANESI
jgi:hypothetical protein